jgi:hypothetical protein
VPRSTQRKVNTREWRKPVKPGRSEGQQGSWLQSQNKNILTLQCLESILYNLWPWLGDNVKYIMIWKKQQNKGIQTG